MTQTTKHHTQGTGTYHQTICKNTKKFLLNGLIKSGSIPLSKTVDVAHNKLVRSEYASNYTEENTNL